MEEDTLDDFASEHGASLSMESFTQKSLVSSPEVVTIPFLPHLSLSPWGSLACPGVLGPLSRAGHGWVPHVVTGRASARTGLLVKPLPWLFLLDSEMCSWRELPVLVWGCAGAQC